MSHFTTVKTKMTDKAALVAALKDLKYDPKAAADNVATLTVRGWMNRTAKAEVLVASQTENYDIGFHRPSEGEAFVGEADWSMIKERTNGFEQQLAQRYAYNLTTAKLAEQGFNLVEETNSEGVIQLVARRVV